MLDIVILTGVGHVILREQLMHDLDGLIQHLAADHTLGVRAELRLEFLTVSTQADAEHHAAAGELIERGDLLGHHQGIAEGDDQQRRSELQGRGPLGDRRQLQQGSVVTGRLVVKLLAHIILGGDVVVAPNRVEAELFRVDGKIDNVPCGRVRDGIHQALSAGCNTKSEICLHVKILLTIFFYCCGLQMHQTTYFS